MKRLTVSRRVEYEQSLSVQAGDSRQPGKYEAHPSPTLPYPTFSPRPQRHTFRRAWHTRLDLLIAPDGTTHGVDDVIRCSSRSRSRWDPEPQILILIHSPPAEQARRPAACRSLVDPLDYRTTFGYDKANRQTALVDANDQRTTLLYTTNLKQTVEFLTNILSRMAATCWLQTS